MELLALFIISLVINTASYFIQRALAPKPKDPRNQEFQAPTSEAGRPIPVWWGTCLVAPNSVWWGNLLRTKHKQFFYSISQHLLLGWGVVNEIIDVQFGGKSCRNHVVDGDTDVVMDGAKANTGAPVDFILQGNIGARSPDLSDRPMFGGDEQGGGIGADIDSQELGHVCMYWGFDDETAQPVDDYLSSADVYDMPCSRWPNWAYMRMGSDMGNPFYICAQDATPKAMTLLLRRTAWWDKDNTDALSPLGQTAAEATIGTDANPAEVLYDILTHKGYGIGRDPDRIDVDSFTDAAIALRDEALGISVVLTQQTDADQVIRDILTTIDATLATNPVTGKLRLKLIRADYDVDDLPVFDASNTSSVKYSPATWAETLNEVRVTYRRFINNDQNRGYVNDVVTDQDQANFQSTNKIRSVTLDFPYLTTVENAGTAAARARRAQSVPIARYSFNASRLAFNVMKGDVVRAQESAFGVDSIVLRVVGVDYGSLEDGKIHIDAMQDVFSVTQPTYAAPTSGWTSPDSTTTDTSGEGTTPPDADGVDWDPNFYG